MKPRHGLPLLLGGPARRDIQPGIGFDVVLRRTIAFGILVAENKLGYYIALFGTRLIVSYRSP